MEFSGMDKSAPNSRSEPAACEPGCACNAPSGRKGIKIAASLLVLVAVIGVLIYKASGATLSAANDTAAANTSVFSVVAQTTPEAAPAVVSQPSNGMQAEKGVESAAAKSAGASGDGPSAAPPVAAKAIAKVGEYIEAFSDLNKVAVSQNAVVVFIPRDKDEAIQGQTNDAVLAAQKTLKSSNITLGLYTLLTSSPDYAGIAKQVQPPAILVSSKGGRMAVVSGAVTEAKLLQAYVTSSRAGGCGPAGCGPAAAGCGPAAAGCN